VIVQAIVLDSLRMMEVQRDEHLDNSLIHTLMTHRFEALHRFDSSSRYAVSSETMERAAMIHSPVCPDGHDWTALMDGLRLVLDLSQIRDDFHTGKLSGQDLLDILGKQHRTIRNLLAERKWLRERLRQYESDTTKNADSSSTSDKPDAAYSVDAENKRRGRRRRPKSPGRTPTEEKFAQAERVENIYPEGIRHSACTLVRERAIWRIEDGRAVRVGYRIHAGPDGQEPRIAGVTPRCEYGIEVLVVLAFLVYIIGISLDKACLVLGFFCQLPLSKSQADALLRQLAQHWEEDYDALCELIVHAAIVYMDETGWKVGNENCSLWAFASELHRVFLFGCHKDDATLDAMLPPDEFDGIGVSDNAAVYAGRFTKGQKCWAHLLRKAIKLALMYPDNKIYQTFLDQLLEIYQDAKRSAADGRLGEAGRKQRVTDLEGRLCAVIQPHAQEPTASMKPPEQEFAKLANELGRLVMAEELFTFVLHPDVQATNNSMERELRGPALDRKAGRTNKTGRGAHRRSVIVSVLQSLRAQLEVFSFKTVLAEVTRWMEKGRSSFVEQWQKTLTARTAAPA
jgi:hypothetical protein